MSLPGRRPMSKEILQISLYGDISIRLGERDIAGELSKKSVGLIAYLLCAPGRQISKDTLRDLFWIDAGDKAAYNLRFNLWNIKKHIPQAGGQEFIINSGGVAGIFIYFKAGVTLGNNPDPYNKERKNKMKKLKSKKK